MLLMIDKKQDRFSAFFCVSSFFYINDLTSMSVFGVSLRF